MITDTRVWEVLEKKQIKTLIWPYLQQDKNIYHICNEIYFTELVLHIVENKDKPDNSGHGEMTFKKKMYTCNRCAHRPRKHIQLILLALRFRGVLKSK